MHCKVLCMHTGAGSSCVASGRLLPGASSALPARRGDARCLQFRCHSAMATSAQLASALAPGSDGSAEFGGNGGTPSIANDQVPDAAHDKGGWSLPLAMSRRQAAGGSWRRLAAAVPAAAALPSPGDSCLVHLPSGAQDSVAQATKALPACLARSGAGQQPGQQLTVALAAEESLQGCQGLALTLLPHGVLHNCTGRDLVLEDPQSDGWSAAAAQGTEAVISTGNPGVPPTQVSAALSAPILHVRCLVSGGRCTACSNRVVLYAAMVLRFVVVLQARLALRLGAAVLRSWPFSLAHGCMHQLLLQDCNAGAMAGYFATVGIELRQRTGAQVIHFMLPWT